jgi:outer membrane lipoprotein SlyB
MRLHDAAPHGAGTFALKGGTVINLFMRDMPHLSVDLDLVFPDYGIRKSKARSMHGLTSVRWCPRPGIASIHQRQTPSTAMHITQRLLSLIAAIGAAVMLTGCVYYPAHRGYSAAPGAYPNHPGYAAYGQVINVEYLRGSGSRTSGAAGAVIGGVVGGAMGNQFGRGGGRALATAAGIAGGALVGSSIERDMNRVPVDFYRVTVQFDDGGVRAFDYPQPPNVRIGDRVSVQGEQLYR